MYWVHGEIVPAYLELRRSQQKGTEGVSVCLKPRGQYQIYSHTCVS